MSARWLRMVAWALPVLAAVIACSSKDEPSVTPTALSGGCLVNSDCAAPLVCAFQRCHAECVTTRDCDGTLRCVGAHEAARVCQLEVEASCKTSVDCATGLVCGSDGACRDHCLRDEECVGGQVCSKGVCAEPTELDDAGNLPQTLPWQTCRLDRDCEAGQRCAAGICVAQCVSDRDCEAGEICAEGACQSARPSECDATAECSMPGQSCVAGVCRCQCLADIDCASGETCDGCACQPPLPPTCSSAQDCETGKQCIDGACSCACVENRDCPEPLTCDGCSCVVPAPVTSIHDATLKTPLDIEAMQGIRDVETALTLTGPGLTDTTGLESIESVGSLELNGLSGFINASGKDPLSGLQNLTWIRGDLKIQNFSLTELSFNPALVVGGNVDISRTELTCAQLETLQQTLAAHGFDGSFVAMQNGSCTGACGLGMCFPQP